MHPQDQEDFYKDQYFTALNKRFDSIEEGQKTMARDVSDIKSKVIYMYAFAAGLGFAASFAFEWAKSYFSGNQPTH